jgi:hypothetical protein
MCRHVRHGGIERKEMLPELRSIFPSAWIPPDQWYAHFQQAEMHERPLAIHSRCEELEDRIKEMIRFSRAV